MCVLLFAWQANPRFALVLAANRDEYYARPAASADFWSDAPQVLAGRDLDKGGTWLGVSATGRFAALTNFRDPRTRKADAPSRGALVADYLRGDTAPGAYLASLASNAERYNDFCLITGNRQEIWYYASRPNERRRLEPGIYGLSNHLLDTPWPKIQQGKQRLRTLLGQDPADAALFELLRDETGVPDNELPQTGVSLEWERALAPLFVRTPAYGTRCSTLLFMEHQGNTRFLERTFDNGQEKTTVHELRFSA